MSKPQSTSAKALNGSWTFLIAASSGITRKVESTPKMIMLRRTPILSARSPNTGWQNMKITSAAAMIMLTVGAARPTLTTRNFCM
ncbi:hypothetical protein D3C85_1741930 [compost metagenome]